jgi:thioredoxin 1
MRAPASSRAAPLAAGHRRMATQNIAQISDDSFKAEVLESDVPVLVDFWAVWCGPCRAIAPHLEALAQELAGKVRVVKLNIDDNQQTPMSYQIRSIPTLLLFKAGDLVDRMTGNPGSKTKLAEFIGRHL